MPQSQKEKCKWEEESRSPSIPSVVFIRCRYPDIKGVMNCISYEACVEYEAIKVGGHK